MNEKFKPVTAITMGDPAGIGPEIVVGTMLDDMSAAGPLSLAASLFWTGRQGFWAGS